jgi:hypothetical protein
MTMPPLRLLRPVWSRSTEAGLEAATQADGFVILPEGSEGYAQGASVLVYLYDEASSRLAMEAVPKP